MTRKRVHRCIVEAVERRQLFATIYVDVNAPGAVHDGTSWGTAYVDLQQALTVATNDSEIHVADGTYRPTGATRSATFQLKNGVSLLGGFSGAGAVNPDQRDPSTFVTILSGDIGAQGVRTDNSYHVVTGSGTTGSAVLDGFTITLGYANGGGSNQVAGGMYNNGGSPTISNCSFVRNYAVGGGAMSNVSSSPMLTNCRFNGNTATSGGAVNNTLDSNPVFTQCVFSGNFESDNGGAAVYNTGDTAPIFLQCTFAL